ncbi:HpcH/HpaI aldolase/citrate lyase family protein [Phytohabitans kaempferiae]|uniref:HpcH/HpaI aldolase/citrate lyase family protein n=1 Tax=Phytohabitans kaempferiae TaxID=1620943 RepID=A0ABV6M331_9ACTN
MTVDDARSLLFVPADRPDRFGKAVGSGADLVILDLEDAVLPERKGDGRAAVERAHAGGAGRFVVRVNAATSEHFALDCAALARSAAPVPVMLPKVEGRAQMSALLDRLPGTRVLALVETARGVLAAREIAAHPATARLAFGSVDFSLDTGAREPSDTTTWARAQLVLASAAERRPGPVDGVTPRLDDPELCAADSALAATQGFTGRLCVHPAQVAPVNRAFTPSADELRWARRVLASLEAGAASVDGEMLDGPVRARAAAVVRRAERHQEDGS